MPKAPSSPDLSRGQAPAVTGQGLLDPGGYRLLFDQKCLLPGESADAYDDITRAVFREVAPQGFIETAYVRDIVDLTWDVVRYRGLKASFLRSAASEGLEKILESFGGHSAEATKRRKADLRAWARGEPGARKKVLSRLKPAGLSSRAITARTLVLHLDQIEQLDRMTAAAEARRESALREIARHRSTLAQTLRHATAKIEDAEFKERSRKAEAWN